MDCLFCKIIAQEIPSQVVYEDDHVVAIRDIQPQAPVHVLILPRKHLATVHEIPEADLGILSHMTFAAQVVAEDMGIEKKGYRLVINCNQEGGQTVYHLHMHLLGGRQLGGSMVGLM